MKKLKLKKRHTHKKSMNVIFQALCIFWIFFLSVSVIQVMAQDLKEYEENDHQTSNQEKLNISAGIGMPEHLNFGICYQLEQVQIGLYIGSAPYCMIQMNLQYVHYRVIYATILEDYLNYLIDALGS